MKVEHQPDAERYALLDGDEVVGIADYEIDGDEIRIFHTEVPQHRRNAGLGGKLVQGTLDLIRTDTSYRVVPACPFVARFVREHPEYADLTKR